MVLCRHRMLQSKEMMETCPGTGKAFLETMDERFATRIEQKTEIV